ncbi:hypothetical protein [Novosphingobium sp. G106]|uniref:hypothetical protein n=1 Tax=Novosphingobium sp. G106 TaxID=2849500 RepID=UPI0020C2E8E1|nr:hypothetical protein [Novosphingobium sp. G106]
MTDGETKVVISQLSRRVTLEGVTVDVQIYRFEDEDEWVLVVANESGSSKVWDEVFPSDIEAMAAFQIVVAEEGLSAFLEQGNSGTLH